MNQILVPVHIRNEELLLLKDRAIFWPARQTLLIADLHIGKVNHFRKHGFAVPQMAGQNNLWRLSGLMQTWKPKTVIFLGDLFHSDMNSAWPEFVDFLEGYEGVEMILVKGNHDILPESSFKEAGLHITDLLNLGPFCLTHDRVESDLYNFHGHVHPGVSLRGRGRQRLKLPCFYFSDSFGILPSFGDFTGLYGIKPKDGDQIFVVTAETVIEVQ